MPASKLDVGQEWCGHFQFFCKLSDREIVLFAQFPDAVADCFHNVVNCKLTLGWQCSQMILDFSEKKPAIAGFEKDLPNLYQGFFGVLSVTGTHRQVITPRAPLAGPFEEAADGDVAGNEIGFGKELDKPVAVPCRE